MTCKVCHKPVRQVRSAGQVRWVHSDLLFKGHAADPKKATA